MGGGRRVWRVDHIAQGLAKARGKSVAHAQGPGAPTALTFAFWRRLYARCAARCRSRRCSCFCCCCCSRRSCSSSSSCSGCCCCCCCCCCGWCCAVPGSTAASNPASAAAAAAALAAAAATTTTPRLGGGARALPAVAAPNGGTLLLVSVAIAERVVCVCAATLVWPRSPSSTAATSSEGAFLINSRFVPGHSGRATGFWDDMRVVYRLHTSE